MRLSKSVSKNATSLYVIESTYIHGKRSTRTVESLGTLEELSKVHDDPIKWANEYIAQLNEKQKAERERRKKDAEVLIRLNSEKQIQKDEQRLFNCGYLFIQSLFYRLGLDTIAQKCVQNTNVKYDLSLILSRMVYGRIISPGSVLHCHNFSGKLLETETPELHDMYRAMSVLAQNIDFIQKEFYQNTKSEVFTSKFGKRKDKVLYYDCTNFFFEIEKEDDLRKYAHGKENRPTPIVGMGLMMDEEGIPLAFSVFPGNTNEQITMTPLEKKIVKDFNHAKFVVCTDSGLSGATNKLFNSDKNRSFITAQSIKKMSEDMQGWAMGREQWRMIGDNEVRFYSLDEIEALEAESLKNGSHCAYFNRLFFKSKKDIVEIELKGEDNKKKKQYVHQTIHVTFSLKYKNYLKQLRNGQIERALKEIKSESNPGEKKKGRKKEHYRQNDYRRFIESINLTKDGEVADQTLVCLKESLIESEEAYDGFYAVATNLDDPVEDILRINKKRWEIEECFRITKDTLEARPIYVSREDRIKAHFLVCFLALSLYRYLEKAVSTEERSYTTDEIISQLRDMSLHAFPNYGYVPAYKRTDFTDRLHQVFGFRTDTEIVSLKNVRQIIQKSKEF